eukprot:179362-Ditylum_brightwellii.AAC.1
MGCCTSQQDQPEQYATEEGKANDAEEETAKNYVCTGGEGTRVRSLAPMDVTHVTVDPSVKKIGDR